MIKVFGSFGEISTGAVHWNRCSRLAAPPSENFGRFGNGLHLPDVFVEARNVSLIVGGIDDVRVGRIRCDVAGLSTAHVIPVGAVDRADRRCGW